MRRRRPAHSIDMLLECIAFVMHQIELELPPVREVINLRACGVPWRDIIKRLPDRVYISMRQDYEKFLRKVSGQQEWKLRMRSQ